ncbi:MAG TPA: hypothetical protein VJ742_04490 [Nitrososphaera sp.]|jgi:hypothetical protein|nr:hypothetical protein [Nitrososphaera sp.]
MTFDSADLQTRAVRERTDLYRQLKEQLMVEVVKYREEGKDNLADIISKSLDE